MKKETGRILFEKLCAITELNSKKVFTDIALIDTYPLSWMKHVSGHPLDPMDDPSERIDYDTYVDHYAGIYKTEDGGYLKVGFSTQIGWLPVAKFHVVAGKMLYIITYWYKTGNFTIEESVFKDMVFGDSDGEALVPYLNKEYRLGGAIGLDQVQLDWPELISSK